jgi:tetratricopeptide (TPR) repeat protein
VSRAVARTTVYVPPGVDSSTAEQADSLADSSFVSLEKQEKAAARSKEGKTLVQISDSLWKYLEMGNDTTQIDSVGQEKRAAAVKAFNRGAKSLSEWQKVRTSEELDSTKAATMQARLLNEAQKAFEEAIQLNPYDQATRNRLGQVYELQAERLGREEAYGKAIKVYEKLTRLRKDSYSPFLNLANSYYQTDQYTKAAKSYRAARETYLESVELSVEEEVEVDSSLVFNIALAEGEALRYARNAESALETYRIAARYAGTEEQVRTAESWVEWINWDDGNIAASFARDSLQSLASRGEFAAAAEGFRTLKSRLQTQFARDEIDWRLAQAEYQSGQQDQAAERLQALVERTETTSEGTPVDSTYQRYFDTYGTICLNLGREKRDENIRTALKYFKQAAEIPWERRALAELEAGKLLRNNVETSIEYLERAAEDAEALEAENQLELYRTLVNQHRRLGHRKEAEKYLNEMRRLKQQASTSG